MTTAAQIGAFGCAACLFGAYMLISSEPDPAEAPIREQDRVLRRLFFHRLVVAFAGAFLVMTWTFM